MIELRQDVFYSDLGEASISRTYNMAEGKAGQDTGRSLDISGSQWTFL